jgi:hypothetical protein
MANSTRLVLFERQATIVVLHQVVLDEIRTQRAVGVSRDGVLGDADRGCEYAAAVPGFLQQKMPGATNAIGLAAK